MNIIEYYRIIIPPIIKANRNQLERPQITSNGVSE